MELLNKIEQQSTKMSEVEKDAWILSQAKLLSESKQEGILLSLSGVKKIINMPTSEEIHRVCEKVGNGEIYFGYETHYYEFDDSGSYMDDWKSWHNDVFGMIPFLDRVFAGCHDLLCLEEYLACADIMNESGQYRERAAYLYYEHGEDDKYVSYLEEHRKGAEIILH